MSTSKLTFSEFSRGSKTDWLNQIEKELKGKDFSSIQSQIEDGITLNPAYHSDDELSTSAVPAKAQDHVDLIEAMVVENEADCNKRILEVLNKGTSALLLYVVENVNLDLLLKDVLIQHVAVHFVVEGEGKSVLNKLEQIVENRGLVPAEIRGSINIDPIECAARTGAWKHTSEQDLHELNELLKTPLSQLKTLCVNANLYHNAGANTSTELALSLAHLHEYLHRFGPENAHRFWLNMAIGPNYLVEVAKFRAMRLLWAKVGEAYGVKLPIHIYAETGLRNKTIFDPNVNMLRNTTEGMSALVGGVDELQIQPYDKPFREASDLATRVARNQALVAQYEAFAQRVNDPAAGAYAIEKLTNELCEKAWDLFKEVEKRGGMIEALQSGWIQEYIRNEAAEEQAEFDSGELRLVGTNVFPNESEHLADYTTHPLFSNGDSSGKDIEKIQAIRLAEKMERERLNSEKA